MGKGVDALLRHVTTQIAIHTDAGFEPGTFTLRLSLHKELCDLFSDLLGGLNCAARLLTRIDPGATIDHFIDAVNDFDKERDLQSSIESSSTSRTEHDRAYQGQIWAWLLQTPDIFLAKSDPIGTDQESACLQLSLSEVEAHNAEAYQNSPRKKGFRLFASGQQRWLALTGHGPDSSKVTELCMKLLQVIARSGREGITQPDLGKQVTQDKRSVPARTDRLAEDGYIVKKDIMIPGKNTARLILKRFYVKETGSVVDKDSWHWTRFGPIIDLLNQAFKGIKEARDTGVYWRSLSGTLKWKTKNKTQASKAMLDALERFHDLGCVRITRMETVDEGQMPRIRQLFHIRDVKDDDWTKFWAIPKGATAYHRRGGVPLKGGAIEGGKGGDNSEVSDQEVEEELSAISGPVNPFNAAMDPHPVWNPDRTLADMTFQAVQKAGVRGITSSGLVLQITGKTYTRPLASLVVDLSNSKWEEHQHGSPRVQLIRDSIQMSRYTAFTFHTSENFGKLVAAGKKSWEAVLRPTMEELDIDRHTFADLNANLFDVAAPSGSLSECLQPALRSNQARYVAIPRSRVTSKQGPTKILQAPTSAKYDPFITEEEYKKMDPEKAFNAWNSTTTNRRYHWKRLQKMVTDELAKGKEFEQAAFDIEAEMAHRPSRNGSDGPAIQRALLPKVVAQMRSNMYMPSRAAHIAIFPSPMLKKMIPPEWRPLKPLPNGRKRQPAKKGSTSRTPRRAPKKQVVEDNEDSDDEGDAAVDQPSDHIHQPSANAQSGSNGAKAVMHAPIHVSDQLIAEDPSLDAPRPGHSKSGRALKQTPKVSKDLEASLFDLDGSSTPKRASVGALTYEQQYNWTSTDSAPGVYIGPHCSLKRTQKGRGKRAILAVFRSPRLRELSFFVTTDPLPLPNNTIDLLSRNKNESVSEQVTKAPGAALNQESAGATRIIDTTPNSLGATLKQAPKRRRSSGAGVSPRQSKRQRDAKTAAGEVHTAVTVEQSSPLDDGPVRTSTNLVSQSQPGITAPETTEGREASDSFMASVHSLNPSTPALRNVPMSISARPEEDHMSTVPAGAQDTVSTGTKAGDSHSTNQTPEPVEDSSVNVEIGPKTPIRKESGLNPGTPVSLGAGISSPASKGKQVAASGRKPRTTRRGVQRNLGSIQFERRAALLGFIRQNGGLFPGDNELWFPYCTMVAKSGVSHRPDLRPVRQEVESMIKSGELKLYLFNFEYTTKNGDLTRPEKKIIAIPGMVDSYHDPKVQDLKKHMIAWHPTKYIPTTVEVDPALRSDFRDQERRKKYEKTGRTSPEPRFRRRTNDDDTELIDPAIQRQASALAERRHMQEFEDATHLLGTPTFAVPGYRSKGPIGASARAGRAQFDRHMRPNKQRLTQRQLRDEDEADTGGPVFLPLPNLTGPEAARQERALRASALQSGQFLASANNPIMRVNPQVNPRMAARMPQGLPMGHRYNMLSKPEVTPFSSMQVTVSYDELQPNIDDMTPIGNQVDSIQQHHSLTGTFGTFLSIPGWFSPKTLNDILDHEWRNRPFDRPKQGPTQTERVLEIIDRISRWETLDAGHVATPRKDFFKNFINITMESQVTPMQQRVRLVPASKYPKHRAKPGENAKNGPRHLDRIQGLKRPGGKANLSTAEQPASKKRKVRGTRNRPQNPALDKRMALAVIMTRILFRGGNSQVTDWDVVQRLLGNEYTEDAIRKRWNLMRTPWKKWIETTSNDLQWRFLDAYEAGELPSLMYDDIEGTEWVKIMAWVEKQTYQELGTRARALLVKETQPTTLGPCELASSRAKLESVFRVKPNETSAKADTFEVRYKGIRLSKRRDWLHEAPEIVPARQSITKSRVDNRTIARSWVRATAVTHNEHYQGLLARQKLVTVPELDIDTAYNELFHSKALMLHNKGREHPERTVDISQTFVSNFRMNLEIPDYQESVLHKTNLDARFKQAGKAEFDDTSVSDGDMITIINLWAAGQITFTPRNLQSQKMGMLAKGSYKTRSINKARLMFNIDIQPTASYKPGYSGNLKRPSPPPRPRAAEQHTSRGLDVTPLPVWIDIHGNETVSVWQSSMNVLLYLCMVRPGITSEVLAGYVHPTMEAWEIRLLMKWAVEARLAEWVAGGTDGIKLRGDWWGWVALNVPSTTMVR